MKSDITTRSDIEKLVTRFYEKIKADKRISFFFSEVVPVNWEHHLSLMCNFWENVLFYTGNYQGNPLATHRAINTSHPTSSVHFDIWIKLFDETVDEYFEGENAAKIKQHAKAIATVMQQKM